MGNSVEQKSIVRLVTNDRRLENIISSIFNEYFKEKIILYHNFALSDLLELIYSECSIYDTNFSKEISSGSFIQTVSHVKPTAKIIILGNGFCEANELINQHQLPYG